MQEATAGTAGYRRDSAENGTALRRCFLGGQGPAVEQGGGGEDIGGMAPSSLSFSESLDRNAHQQQVQMWQAAETVRAHIPAGDDLDSMLDCLGLATAERPLPC
jgi:hypothetical protein